MKATQHLSLFFYILKCFVKNLACVGCLLSLMACPHRPVVIPPEEYRNDEVDYNVLFNRDSLKDTLNPLYSSYSKYETPPDSVNLSLNLPINKRYKYLAFGTVSTIDSTGEWLRTLEGEIEMTVNSSELLYNNLYFLIKWFSFEQERNNKTTFCDTRDNGKIDPEYNEIKKIIGREYALSYGPNAALIAQRNLDELVDFLGRPFWAVRDVFLLELCFLPQKFIRINDTWQTKSKGLDYNMIHDYKLDSLSYKHAYVSKRTVFYYDLKPLKYQLELKHKTVSNLKRSCIQNATYVIDLKTGLTLNAEIKSIENLEGVFRNKFGNSETRSLISYEIAHL